MGKITLNVRTFLLSKVLLLFTIGRAFADNSAWAKHKSDEIPSWVGTAFLYYIVPAVIFWIIFFILPPYVIKPLRDRRRKKEKGI